MRGDECREYCDYHRDGEKHDGGGGYYAVTQEGASSLSKDLCGLDNSPRFEHSTAILYAAGFSVLLLLSADVLYRVTWLFLKIAWARMAF